MKKHIYLLVLSLIVCGNNLNAQEINFELFNKSNQPIWVALVNNETVLATAEKIEPGKTFQKTIDQTKATYFGFWRQEPIKPNVPTKWTLSAPNPDRAYSFSTFKKVLVTWDGQRLRPQTGPLKGLLGRTQSGLSLQNNVNPAEIFYLMLLAKEKTP